MIGSDPYPSFFASWNTVLIGVVLAICRGIAYLGCCREQNGRWPYVGCWLVEIFRTSPMLAI